MRRVRRGAAAAELALLLPLIGFLFAVALDYCRAFAVSQAVQSCADAGAAHGGGSAQSSYTLSREAAARQGAVAAGAALSPPLTAGQVTVEVGAAGVTVTVRHDLVMLTPLLGGKIELRRTATMPLAPRIGD